MRVQGAPFGRAVHSKEDGAIYRRERMITTPYHLYYFVEAGVIIVVAVWSGQRGKGPSFTPRGA